MVQSGDLIVDVYHIFSCLIEHCSAGYCHKFLVVCELSAIEFYEISQYLTISLVIEIIFGHRLIGLVYCGIEPLSLSCSLGIELLVPTLTRFTEYPD